MDSSISALFVSIFNPIKVTKLQTSIIIQATEMHHSRHSQFMLTIILQEFGFSTMVLSNRIRGEARNVGSAFAGIGVGIISKVAPLQGLLRQLYVEEDRVEDMERVRTSIPISS